MALTFDQVKRDHEKYRKEHGEKTLFPYGYRNSGSIYVMKTWGPEVVMIHVPDGNERVITQAEFEADYTFLYLDEMQLHFGCADDREAARKGFNHITDLINSLVYGRSVVS